MTKKPTTDPYARAEREIAKRGRAHAAGKGKGTLPQMTTPERLVRAQEAGAVVDYETRRGAEAPGQQSIHAAPLDRLHRRGMLAPRNEGENERLYRAGNLYRFDWYLGQMSGHKAPNLLGAGSGFHPNGPSPFFADSAVAARQRYTAARRILGKHFREFATMVLCDEREPAEVAKVLTCYTGIKNSEAVGADRLRIALAVLADFYDHYERRRKAA